MANPCLQPQQGDFRGYPFVVYTETKSQSFEKNNCSGGQTGSSVIYSKTYTSYLSQDDLENKIYQDRFNYNIEGQAYANTNGSCSTTCQTLSEVAQHAPIAIASTQVWLMSGYPYRPVTPYSKTSYTNGSNLSSQPVIMNQGSPSLNPWRSTWPHSNANIIYTLGTDNTSIILYTRNTTTGNACTNSTSTTIYNSLKSRYCSVSNMVVLSSGILFLIGYSHTSGVKSFDLFWYPFFGNAQLIHSQPRPHSSVYFAWDSALIYDGSSAYMMLSYASNNNNKRTRTAFFQIGFSGGTPTNVVDIGGGFDYSNQNVSILNACHCGSKLFFLYEEDNSMKVIPIYGGSVSMPSNISNYMRDFAWMTIRDSSSTQNAYFGSFSSSRLIRYTANTDTWTILH